ncbi:uncharacterized protein LOC121601717 [Anopheles merus]|uniref:uncharacterized protein LOC121601717 n=1 Tax=Anopheles merus TaxID=30066 RepID=UPI001BE3D878|nr:uncharacterized protein LOC121601717 [Anopheles merus]
MTRWWWFRACNNPNSHSSENGSILADGRGVKSAFSGRSCFSCDTDYISSPDDAGNNSSSNGGLQHGIRSTSILAAAQSLAMALQQQSSTLHPSPDPITADIINTWLDSHLPAAYPDVF